jgi:hypothetical protein
MFFIKRTLVIVLTVVFYGFFSGCAAVPAPETPPPAAHAVPPRDAGPAPLPRDTVTLEAARLEAAKLTKSDSPRNYASPAVFANFREIRLGAIPARRLYRSSHPALPGNPRFPYAQQLAENARVQTVLNLVDGAARAAVYADNIPWYQNFINRKTIITLEMGVDYTDPAFEEKTKAALLFITSHNGPYLIHGNEGRDRTGFLAALLEALTGATAAEITADYMASYENYYHLEPDSESFKKITVIAEDILLTITDRRAPDRVNLPEAATEYLRRRIGLSAEEIAALRARLEH